jgi:hypothetical protein
VPEYQRIIGQRRQRVVGELRAPTREVGAWVRAMDSRRSGVPKGLFRYRKMEEANADWERWRVELVVETAATSGIKARR